MFSAFVAFILTVGFISSVSGLDAEQMAAFAVLGKCQQIASAEVVSNLMAKGGHGDREKIEAQCIFSKVR